MFPRLPVLLPASVFAKRARLTAPYLFLQHCSATTSHAPMGCLGDVRMAAPARWSRLSARQPLVRFFLIKCANTFVQLGRLAHLQQNARMEPGLTQAMTAVSDSARPAARHSMCVWACTAPRHCCKYANTCFSADTFPDLAVATLTTNTCSRECVSNANYPSWCDEAKNQCVCPQQGLDASYLAAGIKDYGCVTDCKYSMTCPALAHVHVH